MLVGCRGNLGTVGAGELTGLGGSTSTSGGTPSQPTDISGVSGGPLAYFVQQVWSPTVSQDCLACHITHGYAPSHGAGFVLQPPSQAGYLNANHEMFSNFAKRQVNGQSYLMQKMTNAIAHGGGQRLLTTDARYKQIADWLATPSQSSDLQLTTDKLQNLRMLDATATLRKAAMQLAHRQPTPQELTLAQQGNIDIALDSVLASSQFLDFVSSVYNKLYSYSNTLAGNFVASDRMDADLFTHDERYWWGATSNTHGESAYTEASIGFQAENLAKYIVGNNRPFTEMVTADYFVANPFGAHAYGVFDKVTWTDPNNDAEYQAIPASLVQTANGQAFPMAGTLTLESFMNTYPTTGSNRNRRRARYVYSMFLNMDIMALAQTPPNLAKIIASSNPNTPATMTNTACVSCHSLLDQVAGDFANWNSYGYFSPNSNDWYGPAVMAAAGFEGTLVPDNAPTRLTWLGQQIAGDPRFADAVVSQWLLALTGNGPLRDPAVTSTLQESIAAKLYQEQVLHDIANAFVASNFNLKAAVKGIIQSPYYRATDAATAVSTSDAAMLNSFMSYHWRGSQDLNAGLQAGLGTSWITDRVYYDTLNQEYATLMTGADATGFSARVTTIMGSNVACYAFWETRYGFYSGAPWMMPSPVLNAEDPQSVTGAQNLQDAINTLINKEVPLDTATATAEQAAAWSLYQSVYAAALASPNDTPQVCIGGGLAANVVATDEAWIAVLTYVTTDPELLFE